MSQFSSRWPFVQIGVGLAAALLATAALSCATHAPSKSAAQAKLTGQDLYSINCGRCHPERYPTERTAAQWQTIMLHMQVRANLPPDQAKAILKYLQEDSGR
jgi:mono/diheme cytochrome c family protein